MLHYVVCLYDVQLKNSLLMLFDSKTMDQTTVIAEYLNICDIWTLESDTKFWVSVPIFQTLLNK